MDAGPSASSQLNKGDDYASITKVIYCLKLNFFYLTRIGNTVFGNSPTLVLSKKNWPWRITKSMDFVPSILFQYSVIDDEVYDLLKVNMRIEKCEEGTEWTEQGRKHTVTFILLSFFFTFSYPIILRLYLIVHFFTFYLVWGVVKNDI